MKNIDIVFLKYQNFKLLNFTKKRRKLKKKLFQTIFAVKTWPSECLSLKKARILFESQVDYLAKKSEIEIKGRQLKSKVFRIVGIKISEWPKSFFYIKHLKKSLHITSYRTLFTNKKVFSSYIYMYI